MRGWRAFVRQLSSSLQIVESLSQPREYPQRAGSSAITSAGFTVAIGHADPGDNPDLHFRDTMTGGGEINDRRLVRIFCDEAVDRFWELTRWGVQFEREQDGSKYVQYPSGDHSKPRVTVCVTHKGTGITLPLKDLAAGATYLDRVMILDLMRDSHGISGAIALDTQTHELICISSRETILATGGVGQLYPVTSNPNDVTGDSLALAFRAGAMLRDLEFVQFYPWRLINHVRSRMPIQPSSFATGAMLKNADGNRFMLGIDPDRGEATTRDIAARGIYTEIVEGRGIEGGVLLDLSEVPLERFAQLNPRVADYFDKRGQDLSKLRLILAPEAHYHMGGVQIDEWGHSSVGSLYAVGEAAAGVDGGNRLNSNTIPAGQVFGRRAGQHAGMSSKSRGDPGLDTKLVQLWQTRLGRFQTDQMRTEDASSLKDDIREVMLKHGGIIRSGQSLDRGIQKMREIRLRISQGQPSNAHALPEYLEAENMALAGELILTAAHFRSESRSAHYRTDCPEHDDSNWQTSVEVQMDEGGEIEVKRYPARDEISFNIREEDFGSSGRVGTKWTLASKGELQSFWPQVRGSARHVRVHWLARGPMLSSRTRRNEPLENTQKEIEQEAGRRVLAIQTDITLPDQLTSLIRRAKEAYGRIDILVTNSGPPRGGKFGELSEDDWDQAISGVTITAVNACRQVLPIMQDQRWGRIIHITSTSVKQPLGDLMLSSAARLPLLGLSKIIANQYAQQNILSHVVCPGPFLTEAEVQFFERRAQAGGLSSEEAQQEWIRDIPQGRIGAPEEFGDVVAFLASERASYMTGTVIQVDGGRVQSIA